MEVTGVEVVGRAGAAVVGRADVVGVADSAGRDVGRAAGVYVELDVALEAAAGRAEGVDGALDVARDVALDAAVGRADAADVVDDAGFIDGAAVFAEAAVGEIARVTVTVSWLIVGW
ncbi:hypothetical protein [Candidatus Corynebacterium faecigallinarum]|uniref:hypothetical protein n=1 Tax=Candidatus Corynebacterium faecigallinarum TaxID=2838528 RepID=UPI003FD4C9DC